MNKLIALFISFTLCSCGIAVPMSRSEKKLRNIDLGMDRPQVRDILGEPNRARGSTKLPTGETLKIDEYLLYPSNTGLINFGLGIFILTFPWWIPPQHPNAYWIQYVDGKLDKWGRAGDWNPTVTGDLTIRNK